jgi:hypothetical protein
MQLPLLNVRHRPIYKLLDSTSEAVDIGGLAFPYDQHPESSEFECAHDSTISRLVSSELALPCLTISSR